MSNPTIEAYDRYAQVYQSETTDFWQQYPNQPIKQFANNLLGNLVLDIGSGAGGDALRLRDEGLDVVCYDASQAMVNLTTDLGFESHQLQFDELETLPADSVDGVWAYASLIHIEKPQLPKVIKDIAHVLRPCGLFAVGFIHGQGSRMVQRASMPDAERHFSFYQDFEMQAMVQSAAKFTLFNQHEYRPKDSTSTYMQQIYELADLANYR